MNLVARNLVRISARVDKWVAVRFGPDYPLHYVVEYPRGGGTWLGDMVADYLQIPFPKHNLFPLVSHGGLIHGHWSYDRRLTRNIMYMYRDGRDTVVSLFFFCTRPIRGKVSAGAGGLRYIGKRFPYLLEPGTDLDDCAGLLPRFIEDWVRKPYGCRASWPDHVRDWAFDRPGVVTVSYEGLRTDATGELTRVLGELTGGEPDPERVRSAVARFTFEKQTGRKAGSHDASSPKRKGVVGDWRNYFSREAGEVFDRLCGDVLVDLGYETDRDWYRALPPLADLRRARDEAARAAAPTR